MNKPTLERIDLAHMLTTPPPPVRWVAEGLVLREGVTLLSGEPGVGKSMLGMTLGVCVARGTPFLGGATAAGTVMYVDAENGTSEVHRRVQAMGLAVRDAGQFHYLTSREHDMIQHRSEIIAYAEEINPTLIVLDSFRSLWRGDENDSNAAAHVMQTAVALTRTTGAGVLILHHVPKNTSTSYRGSSAFGGAVEVIATLRRTGASGPATKTLTLGVDKCRVSAEVPDRYMHINITDGVLAISESDKQVATPVREELRELLLGVIPFDPDRISQGDACRAVDRGTKDRSVRDALTSLQDQGVVNRDDAGWYQPSGGVYSLSTPTPGGSTPPQTLGFDDSGVSLEVS